MDTTEQLTHQSAEFEGTEVVEVREVPGTPRSGTAAPGPTEEVEARADLTSELVSSTNTLTSYTPWLQNRYIQQLPHPSDDLMQDFGSQLYERDMGYDPQVYSTLSTLDMAVLCQSVRLDPPVQPTHPDYDAAVKVQKFAEYCLRNTNHAMPAILYEELDGMFKVGHKVGEQVYELQDIEVDGETYNQAMVLIDIKPKPHDSTAFIVDPYNNVLGLAYVRPGRSLPTISQLAKSNGAVNGDLSGEDADGFPKIIPRAKFFIPTHKPRNGDPRGTSHLRPVYTPWWKKLQDHPQHLAYIARFSQPSVVANIDKELKDVKVKDPVTGQVSNKSLAAVVNEGLMNVKAGATFAAVGTDTKLLESDSDGAAIFKSYDLEDRQIAKGILMQALTTEEGEHMARAAAAVHQDVFGLLIAFVREILEWSIQREIIYWLIFYNFGRDAAKNLLPVVSLGDTQVQDTPALMASYAQLANSQGGVPIHRTMWPAIRAQLSMPPSDKKAEEADWAKMDEQKEAMMQAQQQAQQGAPSSPGGARPASQPGQGSQAPSRPAAPRPAANPPKTPPAS